MFEAGIRKSLGASLLSLLVFCSDSAVGEPSLQEQLGRVPTIMAIGDSITAGDSSGGYRRILLDRLAETNYFIDFVGTQQNGAFPDSEFEGYPGRTPADFLHPVRNPSTGTILPSMDDILSANIPDIALIHLGTNGLSSSSLAAQYQSAWGQQVEDIRQIVDKLVETNPNVYVLVAQIIQTRDAPGMQEISEFNRQLAAMANYSLEDRVALVNMESILGFDPQNYTDRVHPSASGYSLMAEAWVPPLTTILSGNAPVPLPATVWLLSAGLTMLVGFRSRSTVPQHSDLM